MTITSPRKGNLLVLDLDETLVWSTYIKSSLPTPDYQLGPIVGVWRPYLREFLAYAHENFHVGIWTASGQDYANQVIETFSSLDDFSFIWCNDRCTFAGYGSAQIKDIRKLRRHGWRREAVIAVDNLASPWSRSYGNLCQVPDFCGYQGDDCLFKLTKFLDRVKDAPDVRALDLRGWQLK